MNKTFWEWFLSALFFGYALFWLGVYFGERGMLRAWVPFSRKGPQPVDVNAVARQLGQAARREEERLVRSIFEDGKAKP